MQNPQDFRRGRKYRGEHLKLREAATEVQSSRDKNCVRFLQKPQHVSTHHAKLVPHQT